MTTRITILGSSGRFATAHRASSGYLLEIDGHRLWLDAGAGTWRNLLGQCAFDEVDGVILTHRHPDHVTDVYQLQHALLYGPKGRLPEIPLWAPAQTIESMSAYDDLHDAFEPHVVAGGDSIEVAGATIRFVSMAHPPETVGVRVETADGVLAYSADSGEEADFEALAGGAGLFVCEASNQDSDDIWEGHLRASQAARIATGAGVERLVLTHLPVERDLGLSLAEAQAAVDGPSVQLAADGDSHEVGR
ncbi:MAG TPA: MBL fold metallo-hydrolase [Actinomycetota bacterium]|nr:MBL fold metallo-hydrolase [Actinomycetota bacterium]